MLQPTQGEHLLGGLPVAGSPPLPLLLLEAPPPPLEVVVEEAAADAHQHQKEVGDPRDDHIGGEEGVEGEGFR